MARLAALVLWVIASRAVCQSSSAPPSPPAAPSPPAPEAAPGPSGDFFTRFGRFLWNDWHPVPNAPAAPAPPRRGLPSPLDSPPFFTSDWGYGGAPTIGEPDTAPYALSTALHLAHSRTKLYGWLEPSANLSTSSHSNSPEGDDYIPNAVTLSRIVLIAERLPDTVQQDHVDWGFRITNLFGTDYRFNIGKGYLSSQLIDHNRQYGYDTTFDYLDVYLPHVAQGMILRAGRFPSVPGIESQIPPFNYTFSHSLLNITDAVSDTGLIATVKLSDQWLVQLGITGGHDVALWSGDAKPSLTACADYTTRSVNDNLYLCANGINDGRYAYNNIQQFDGTWYHRFSRRFHTATEAWVMYQRDVPAAGGPVAPEPNTNPAACRPGLVRCFAPEYAVLNYLPFELGPHDALTLRNEFLNDKKGQRTGTQTRFTEQTLSWTHWVGTTLQIRPELRFEHSWDRPAYDTGHTDSQFTAATDLVLHF